MSAMEFFYTNSPTSQRTTHGEMLSRTAGSPLHLTQFDHGISNHFYEYSQRPQPPVDFSFVEQLGMDATSVTCSNSNTFIPTNQSTEYCAASFFPPAAPGQVAGSHWSTSFDQGCQGQIYETPVGRGITGASGPAPNSIPGVLISYSDTGNYTSNVRNEASNHVIEPSQVLLRSNEEEHQLSQ